MKSDREPSQQVLDPSLHAVSYLRVSTKDQATKGGEPEGLSIPAQREAIDNKAASSYNCAIRRHFSDMGESARTADRPGLQELLEYLKNNHVDFVFVHKIDRLARNRFDDIEITLAIQKSGARLVSVTENIDETPSGMLMHGIMSSIAEFYSRNLANEVKKGMRQKVRSGGTPGRAPLGYLNTRTIGPSGGDFRTVIIDPERAHLVRMAFELYASGDYSIEALQAELTAQGLTSRPTPKSPAKPFSRPQLCLMLRNKYYMGIVTYEGEEFQGRHEALVAPELFARVQDVLDMRRRRGSRDRVHKHYLKGLLFCDRCFEAGRTRRLIYSENVNWQGNVYAYFKCRGRQEGECDLPYLPVDLVEDAVVDFYPRLRIPVNVATALAADLEECILAEGSTTRELHRNLRARIAGLDQQEERLLDLAMEGSLPQAKIRERLAKIEVDRRDALTKLQQTSSQIAAGVNVLRIGVQLLNDPQPVYRQSPPMTRGQFDRSFFSRLFLDDRATVTHGDLNTPFSDIYGGAEVSAPSPGMTKAPENLEGLRTDPVRLQPDPWVKSWSKTSLVAGAGFQPATSGRHQGHRDYYDLGPETTENLGGVRESPSLPDLRIPDS